MRDAKIPGSLTPLNIYAWLCNAFELHDGHMGVLGDIERHLEWIGAEMDARGSYEALYPSESTYYVMAGLLYSAGTFEYGVSIRCPWLTSAGEKLLAAIKTLPDDAFDRLPMDDAYDGCTYGQVCDDPFPGNTTFTK